MSAVIRPWRAEDIPVVAEMEQICFSDPWSQEMLADCLRYPHYACFLAEEGGQVCGYCIVTALFEEGEVMNIAVSPAFRKRGVAKRLLSYVHEGLKGAGVSRMLLEVRKSNAPAISLYESFGYRQYGVRERYYEDGEDALLMEKTL